MDSKDVADTLREVMRATALAERGFRSAAERVVAHDLVTMFRERARSCRVAIDDLRFALRAVAPDAPEAMGSDGGPGGRWAEEPPREAVAMDDPTGGSATNDRDVLATVERDENAALAAYLSALARPLPEDVKKIVRSHLDGVQHDRDRLRALIDAADGSPTQARVTRL